METGQFGFILFFSVYGIDAVITIISRLRKKENIFEAHRSHLYQYLANEKGYSHVVVAFTYAVIQLVINIFVFYMNKYEYLSIYVIGLSLLVLTLVYVLIRASITRQLMVEKS